MRTTIRLDDALLREAKARAARAGRSLNEFIEDAVRVAVLVYAVRADAVRHAEYHAWLTSAMNGAEPVGLSELVLSAVVRVLTHPRVFDPPSRLSDALASGAELITTDRDFARFPVLRWRHPLE